MEVSKGRVGIILRDRVWWAVLAVGGRLDWLMFRGPFQPH